MLNVSPQNWGVNLYYFSILFTLFQLVLTSALRRSGGSDEDLGLFGRHVDFIWNRLTNGNGGGGVHLTWAGNQVVIEGLTVSPPAYEDCNVDRYRRTFGIDSDAGADERFYSP